MRAGEKQPKKSKAVVAGTPFDAAPRVRRQNSQCQDLESILERRLGATAVGVGCMLCLFYVEELLQMF